jgi:hypothetical protein
MSSVTGCVDTANRCSVVQVRASIIGLVKPERRATLNERRPALLENGVILWPDIRRTGFVGSPVVAIIVPLRASSR